MEEEERKLIVELAGILQKDCHKLVDELMDKHKMLSHQDATNVWLFKKLAEFEIRLIKLEK